MKQMIRFGLILGLICLVASFVLGVTYRITRPEIQARIKEEEERALRLILPEADTFKKGAIDDIEYYEGYRDDELIGYCVKVMADGYSGYIHMIVGIDKLGIIKGVEVISHKETPGLGSRIKEVKRGEDEPWFLRQFKGKDARTISIKDIDVITSATITSHAIVEAINRSIKEFLLKKKGI